MQLNFDQLWKKGDSIDLSNEKQCLWLTFLYLSTFSSIIFFFVLLISFFFCVYGLPVSYNIDVRHYRCLCVHMNKHMNTFGDLVHFGYCRKCAWTSGSSWPMYPKGTYLLMLSLWSSGFHHILGGHMPLFYNTGSSYISIHTFEK